MLLQSLYIIRGTKKVQFNIHTQGRSDFILRMESCSIVGELREMQRVLLGKRHEKRSSLISLDTDDKEKESDCSTKYVKNTCIK